MPQKKLHLEDSSYTHQQTKKPFLQNGKMYCQLKFKFCSVNPERELSFDVLMNYSAEEVKCYKKMRKSFDEEFCTTEDYDRFFNLTTKEKNIFSRQIYDIFVIKFKEDKYAQSLTCLRPSMVN